MHWEQHGKRQILYQTVKRQGRVIKQHLGRGELANIAYKLYLLTTDLRNKQQESLRQENKQFERALHLTEDFGQFVQGIFKAEMIAGGYDEHPTRQWKQRQPTRHNSDDKRG